MQYSLVSLALVAGASAVVVPRSECSFTMTATGGETGTIGDLGDGQHRIGGGLSPSTFTISDDGSIVDEIGRGCILAGGPEQWQCDLNFPPLAGHSIAANGSLTLPSGSTTFYACPASDTEWNLYAIPVANQPKCVEIGLTASSCYGSGKTTGSSSSTGSSSTSVAAIGSSSVPAVGTTAPVSGASTPVVTSPVAGTTAPSVSSPSDETVTITIYNGQNCGTEASSIFSTASTPAESSPVVPVGQTSVVSTVVESTSVATVGSSSVPVPSGPAGNTSTTVVGTTAPVSSSPAQSTPATSAPVESSPVASSPASSVPVESSSVASTPAVSSPVVGTTAPVESSPVASTPVASTPAVSSPAVGTTTPVVSYPAGNTSTSVVGTTVPVLSSPPSEETVTITVYNGKSCGTEGPSSVFSSTSPAQSSPVVGTTAPVESSPVASTPAVSTTAPVASSPAVSSPAVTPATGTAWTTSVVYTTYESTISNCAATVASCPPESQTVTTVTVPQYTTICPVTATETGATSPAVTPVTETAWTTSVHYTTYVSTISNCAATVASCPSESQTVTTVTVPEYTTICPVTATETGSVTSTHLTISTGTVTVTSQTATVTVSSASSNSPAKSSAPGSSGSSTVASSVVPSSSAATTCTPPLVLTSGGPNAEGVDVNYMNPHLIIPVSSLSPDTAAGTQYFGDISSNTSTIFNFDIPASYEGKTCSLLWMLPEKKDLETTDYTYTGQGTIDFAQLSTTVSQDTTYNNAPSVKTDYGNFDISVGTTTVISTFACPASTTVTYEMKAIADTYLYWFEDWNPSPLGLFITKC